MKMPVGFHHLIIIHPTIGISYNNDNRPNSLAFSSGTIIQSEILTSSKMKKCQIFKEPDDLEHSKKIIKRAIKLSKKK